MVFLDLPHSSTAFAGTYYPALNGAMWTIPYEFRCYIIAAIMGGLGLLRRGWVLLLASLAMIFFAPSIPPSWLATLNAHHLHADIFTGDPRQAISLTGFFLVGAAFRALKDQIIISPSLLWLSVLLLILSLSSNSFCEIGVALFGAYCLFSTSDLLSTYSISNINNKNDISYGVYLYAWPIEKLVIQANISSSPILVGLLTWAFAILAGSLSWFLVEKPVMIKFRPST